MNLYTALFLGGGFLGLLVVLIFVALWITLATFQRIYNSVKVCPPLTEDECELVGLPKSLAYKARQIAEPPETDTTTTATPESGMTDVRMRESALFKYLPQMREKLAWAPLGNFPTPIHMCELPIPIEDDEEEEGEEDGAADHGESPESPTDLLEGEQSAAHRPRRVVRFMMKREDLSSSRYGGNKVRTLEHQLPCAVADLARRQIMRRQLLRNKRRAQREASRGRRGEGSDGEELSDAEEEGTGLGESRVFVFGAPGSNQCVAASAHALVTEAPVCSLWFADEAPARDNGLNLWSVLSFPFPFLPLFTLPVARRIASFMRLVWGRISYHPEAVPHKILCLGGANVTGALGHVGAALELAHQIEAGLLPEPRHIFLPLGSGCTTAGLSCGIAVAKVLGVGFKRPIDEMVVLHPVVIHHILAGVPFVTRALVRRLACDCAQMVYDLTGIDARMETRMMLAKLDYITDKAGQYGGHTPESWIAKDIFSDSQILEVSEPDTSIFTQARMTSRPTIASSTSSGGFHRRNISDVTKKQQYLVAEDTDLQMNEARSLEKMPSPLPRPWLDSTFAGKCAVALIQKFKKRLQNHPPLSPAFTGRPSVSRMRQAEDVRTGCPDTVTDPSLRGEGESEEENRPGGEQRLEGTGSGESELRLRHQRRRSSLTQTSPPSTRDPRLPTYRSDPQFRTGATEIHHASAQMPGAEPFISSPEILDCTDILLWTTKSLVQPQGELSEAETRDRLASGYPNVARRWFQECWDIEGITNVPEAIADIVVDVQGRV